MSEQKKIMLLIPPAMGHVNPMCAVIKELLNMTKDVKVLFYSDEEYRETITKSGAQFRLFARPSFTEIVHKQVTDKPEMYTFMAHKMITFTYELLPQLIKDVDDEKPDLIIYDGLFSPAKYLLEALKRRFEKGTSKTNPRSAMFLPNFAYNKAIFNTLVGNYKYGFEEIFSLIRLLLRQVWLSFTFDIPICNPLDLITRTDDNLNVIGVMSELQPYREEFDSTFKFVGSCILEQASSGGITNDDELNSVLKGFDINRTRSATNSGDKLIYMALGTVFNVNRFAFDKVIEAIRLYDMKQPVRRFKSAQFKVVIATGEKNLNEIKEKVKLGEIKLPENVLLRAKVAQLELLKRADLFITHCGMNSTNEAIKYSVPMVAIPFQADQPVVAKRVCDDLQLGIRLDPLKLEIYEIADAIDEVLGDEKYARNIQVLSKAVDHYNGQIDGAKIILDYLNKKPEEEKKSD
jgi:UDP:flavonoid glycosyltransferase YjiC (YdhE family)